MTETLSHRGPDGAGVFVRDNVGLGHRRLSIIDHEGGRQPMSTSDGQVHLTYNGEVYNFRELRKELEGKGYRFRTSSDTEVILYAYEAWGRHCVDRFEGMFAFAIADFRKREILLARDHFGIKPVLYRITQNSFAFASEFQAFYPLPDWSGEIDLYAIDLYLRYQYIPAPHTAFRKVFKLPAGHRMIVAMDEPRHTIERYWEPDFSKKRKFRDEELLEELDDTLRDSVKRHLVADVPFGALLSGGIDSSLVVGYMSELLHQPVKTFSIGFEDESVDELKYARLVSQKYGTEHHEEIVKFDALEKLPEIVRHHGEPFGDQSTIPTWYVSQLARSHVPMVLSGDGGDELFAGYGTYPAWLQNVAPPEVLPDRTLKGFLRPLWKAVNPGKYPVKPNAEKNIENWIRCIGRFNSDSRGTLWHRDIAFVSDLPGTTFEDALQSGSGFSGVNRVQRIDLETFLPEDILCKVDIASMRFGLEVRPPMLDRRFFKLASSIPPRQLHQQGAEYCGKLPLKRLAASKLGDEFAFRPKQGFGLPLQSWLRDDTMNSAAVADRLCHADAMINQWFQPVAVNEVIANQRVENIWLLLVLEEWLCQEKNNQRLKASPIRPAGTSSSVP